MESKQSADDLDQREQEIIDRALQLKQDLSILQKSKSDALVRQLRKQLQSEASAQLKEYASQLEAEAQKAALQLSAEKVNKASQLVDVQHRIEEQILQLQTKLRDLSNVMEELETGHSAAEEYLRQETSEKLTHMQQALADQVEARVRQFAEYLSQEQAKSLS